MFNPLEAVRKLQEVGIPREHAEAFVGVLTDIQQSKIAMKQDLSVIETRILGEIERLRLEIVRNR